MGIFNFFKKKEGGCCGSTATQSSSCCSGTTEKVETSCCGGDSTPIKETSCCSTPESSSCCGSAEPKAEPKQEVKAACECGSECGISDIKKARFIVLGACCKKSSESFENVKTAVKELGLEDEVINIGDMAEIAKYGVMQTPAFVIDSKVVSYGKLITVEDAKKLING